MNIKKVVSFLVVFTILASLFIMPASAATRATPICPYCGSDNIKFQYRQQIGTYPDYYLEDVYLCYNCSRYIYIQAGIW